MEAADDIRVFLGDFTEGAVPQEEFDTCVPLIGRRTKTEPRQHGFESFERLWGVDLPRGGRTVDQVSPPRCSGVASQGRSVVQRGDETGQDLC